MKSLLLTCCILITLTADAQLEKGKKLFGIQTNLITGDVYASSWNLSVGSYESHLGLNFVPTLGWAIERNWLLGAQVTLGYQRDSYSLLGSTGDAVYHYYDLGFAPFTRFYIDITRNQKWKVFGMAAIETAHTRTRFYQKSSSGTGPITSLSNTDLKGSLGGGLAYFGKKTSVDLNASVTGLRLGVYRHFGSGKK